MKIYTISTLHDWAHFTGAAGPVGIERIFDYLAIARIERVYWRLFEGGLATYPSKVATVFRGKDVASWRGLGDGGGPKSEHWAMREDCSTWDPLAVAVEVAHRRGIELCGWWTLCEEDHGGHVGSGFGKQKKYRLQDREGKDYPGTVELFLPEVQKYRMKVLDEVLERKVDGLLLDFARNNATPSGDCEGVHRFGFNLPVRNAFKKSHGTDPIDLPADDKHWLEFKNRYRADFVRRIRGRLGRKKHLAVMTIPHVDNRRWLCLDLPNLTKDRTVDLVMPFGMSYCNSPETTAEHIKQLQSQTHGGKSRVAGGIQAYWGMTPDAYEADIAAAKDVGAISVVLYEADMLARMDLITPTRATHLNAIRSSRNVEVKQLRRQPAEKDWSSADIYQGFYIVAGPDKIKASTRTSFQIIAGSRALHVRVICHGKQENIPSAQLEDKKPYLDWVAARNFWMRSDQAHVLLDPGPTRRDYMHFAGERNGLAQAEKRFKNPWQTKWQFKAAHISRTKWQADFVLPYSSIGAAPKSGDRWGFQVIREQRATLEVSSWFVSTAYGVDPVEWGEIAFC